MKIETLLVIMMVLFVLFSAVQAVQISALSQAIANGVPVSGSAQGGDVPTASALSQLPTQVGGCG